jgi:hypothetical protein
VTGNDVEIRIRVNDQATAALNGVSEKFGKLGGIGKAAFAAMATDMSGIIPIATSLAGAILLVPGAIGVAGSALATFKIATAGVGDALDAVGEDTAKFNEAIKDLAPNAQAFVKEVRSLRDEWKDLQQAVQNRFFQGFAVDLKNLAGTYIPKLKEGMTGIAGSMNNMARYAAGALMDPAVVAAVNNVLANTKSFLDNATSSLGNFLGGFLKLASIGSDYLPAVGTWLANIARDFNNWVTANPDKIRGFIDGALTTLGQLKDVVFEVGRLFANMFLNSGQGSSFLIILRDVIGFLADHADVVKGVLYALGTAWVVGKVAGFASAISGVVASVVGLGGPLRDAEGRRPR